MKKDLYNMSEQIDIMNTEIQSINQIYENILFKKDPVGSSKNAIKYLKLPH